MLLGSEGSWTGPEDDSWLYRKTAEEVRGESLQTTVSQSNQSASKRGTFFFCFLAMLLSMPNFPDQGFKSLPVLWRCRILTRPLDHQGSECFSCYQNIKRKAVRWKTHWLKVMLLFPSLFTFHQSKQCTWHCFPVRFAFFLESHIVLVLSACTYMLNLDPLSLVLFFKKSS